VLTHLLGQSPEVLAGNIGVYRQALASSHGPDARGHVALMLHTLIGTDRNEVRKIVHNPFCDYLRSSMDLVVASSGLLPPGLDVNRLPARDKEFLVAAAFDRYFTTSGLFGTVKDAGRTVSRLAAMGVDEIACLIDYGVPQAEIFRSLQHVAELNERVLT
jgi:hypothetical protein